jgi:hypothetical protein
MSNTDGLAFPANFYDFTGEGLYRSCDIRVTKTWTFGANQVASSPIGEGLSENARNRRLEMQLRFIY